MYNAYDLDADRANYEALLARNSVGKQKPMVKAQHGGIIKPEQLLTTAKEKLIEGLIEYMVNDLGMTVNDKQHKESR